MNPVKPTEAKTTPEAPAAKFAVVKEFWLNDKLCAVGSTVELTESQAKRAGEQVKPG
jgi:hypothetical protein